MITKGIIQGVDFTSNTCTVRLPIFEGTTNTAVLMSATIMTVPGISNQYLAGDVVFVGFEDNAFSKPIILGKLFLGFTDEPKARGAIQCNTLCANSVKLPITAEFTIPKTSTKATPVTDTDIATLADLISAVNDLKLQVDELTKQL